MATFINNLTTVSSQVFILFLLIALGFICGKIKLLNDETTKALADISLLFTMPAVIIKSFIMKYDSSIAKSLLLSIVAAVLCHIIGIIIATVIFRQKNNGRKVVFRNSAVLSNASFMALPLQLALLGTMGTFYGAAYYAILNFTLWTYGLATMGGKGEKINIFKLIFNPGLISICIGIVIFLFSFEPPQILTTTITHIANLNTPLPMIVVGFYLSQVSFKNAFKDLESFIAILARLVIVPLASMGVLYLIGFRGDLFVSTVLSVSAPTAVAVTMFTAKYEGETELSANIVSLSTLFSIISMSLIVALAQTIA